MSMRAVAERVGLTSMALYPYVGGKDALLDGLVDLLHLELGAACAPREGSGPSGAADERGAGGGMAVEGPGRSGAADERGAGGGMGLEEPGPFAAADRGAASDEPEFSPRGDGSDWRHRLRALGRAVRTLAHAHPGAFPLLLNRPAAGA